MNRTFLLLTLASFLTTVSAAQAQDQVRADRNTSRALPANIESLRLATPMQMNGVDVMARRASVDSAGDHNVIIRLATPSVAEQKLRGKSAQKAKKNIKAEQTDLLAEVMALDPNARVIAQTQLVLNAVFIEVNPSVLDELAKNPGVLRITPVANYEMDLSETVPYIGASLVQAEGFDGSGVSVAVLDSGLDYNHLALGGSGNPADFAANDPNVINENEAGMFPTAKVVGGYDFVGSNWPNTPEQPDPDPIDDGVGGGHGTHVGHIIGGVGGVAPGADLYAVKVCSSVSTSCSGIALIQGMEFAVDPDGDGDPSDAVDVINMSLGSPYGQPFDDDLSAAVNNATALGTLTVASAGNSGDKPYDTGSPSAAATALSVAQTAVPSDVLPLLQVVAPESISGQYPAVYQSWSAPLTEIIEAPLQYADGAGGNLNGCAPFAADSLAGLIVLVDRGGCNFTLKIKNVGDAGGLAGIIGLVAPGDPFTGGDGGDRPIVVPGYMVSQAISNVFKSGLPDTIIRLDPETGLPLVGSMVGSSARGPQNESTTLIKPEIGAPGASISAIAGTGTGEGPFGGTSGAAPMVAGSAALLLQAFPELSPLEAKAKLMNTGDTDIISDPLLGDLAPITRIGGGEVRIDQTVAAYSAAWDDATGQGALSFGFVDVHKDTVNLFKTVRVRNYSDSKITYNIDANFRFADDAENGAVAVKAPKSIKVGAGQDATFTVKMTIKGALLRGNFMNSGSQGANPAALTTNEYDGYLVLDDGTQPIHMAWHVLPRQASNVVGRQVLNFEDGEDTINLTNNGVGTAQNDAYSLLAVSPNMPEGGIGAQSPMPDIRAVGITTIPVPAGFCSGSDSFLWVFAVNTWERQEHLLPVSVSIELDTNQDGAVDYVVLNRDASGAGTITDGRQLAWVFNVGAGTLGAFFFAEHSTNTGNTALIVCGEQIGMNANNFFQNVDMDVYADDFYYGGPGDAVLGLTVAPLGEQYFGIPDDIAGKSEGSMTVLDFGPLPGNSPELGIYLIGNGDRGAGARGGATKSTEALLFTPNK